MEIATLRGKRRLIPLARARRNSAKMLLTRSGWQPPLDNARNDERRKLEKRRRPAVRWERMKTVPAEIDFD